MNDDVSFKETMKKTVTKGFVQWKGINRKQSTRWQHLSQLKASAFFSFQKKFSCYETQQLILGTGTAIWWLTEPHWRLFLTTGTGMGEIEINLFTVPLNSVIVSFKSGSVPERFFTFKVKMDKIHETV
jgi:hypothetical protein